MNNYMDEFITTVMQLVHFIDKNCHELAATALQREAMKCIYQQPNTTIGFVSSELHLSMSSTTQLLERLEKLHFVKKSIDSHDRRITHLVLTDLGIKELERLTLHLRQVLEQVFSNVPENDLRELTRINKALLPSLERKVLQ